jgi:hypothetical protein
MKIKLQPNETPGWIGDDGGDVEWLPMATHLAFNPGFV